jgi:hypothetical protein
MATKKKTVHTIPEVSRLLGASYHRIYWALMTGRAQYRQVGRTRVLDDAALEALRSHFQAADAGKASK